MFNTYLYFKNLNKEILLEEGSVFNEELNETLDSASVIIKGVEATPLDLQPLDEVVFIVRDETNSIIFKKTMLINSYQESISRQINPVVYNYSITLVSETKKLEGIVCPNLVITNDSKLSIYHFIIIYNKMYGGFKLSSEDFKDFLGVCPNMQWNEPTLRELLNDLCLVKDHIITLQNGYLKPMPISRRGNNFDSPKIIYVNQSQSLENYVSEIHSNLDNVIDLNESKISNDIGFKNNEVAFFSSDLKNLKNGTPRPILEVRKFLVHIKTKPYEGTSDNIYTTIDMSEYVVEAGVYKSLRAGRGVLSEGEGLSNKYKKNCVYYNRGSSDILGITSETNGFLTDISVLEQWKKILEEKIKDGMDGLFGSLLAETSLNDLRFEMEYLSIGKQTYRLSRGSDYQKVRNSRVIFDNQTNSSVDIEKFITFQQQKIKRFSNKLLFIQQPQVNAWSEVGNLADIYSKKFIIYSRTIVFNRKSLDCEYIASKDYIIQNYFVSMNSQKRNFVWIDNKQSVERQEFKKIYYELGFENIASKNIENLVYRNDLLLPLLNNNDNEYMISLYAMSPFIDNSNFLNFYRDDSRNIQITTSNIFGSWDYNSYICVDGNMQVVNNVVNYNFLIDNNVFGGFTSFWKSQNTGEDLPVSAFYNEGINYNADREFNKFTFLGVKFGGHTYMDELIVAKKDYEKIKTASQNFPYNTKSGEKQKNEGVAMCFGVAMYKDNAEKLGLSFCFEWVSNHEDIVILNEVARKSLFYQNTLEKENISIAKNTEFYEVLFALEPTMERTYYTKRVEKHDLAVVLGATTLENIKGLYLLGNKYFSDHACTIEVGAQGVFTSGTNGVGFQFQKFNKGDYFLVYKMAEDKLVLQKLKNHGNASVGWHLTSEKEYDASKASFGVWNESTKSFEFVKVKNFSSQKIILEKHFFTKVNNQNALDFKAYNQNGEVLSGGGEVSVNIAEQYIHFINLPVGTSRIVVNESLEVKNIENKPSDFKIYLHIKDYFNKRLTETYSVSGEINGVYNNITGVAKWNGYIEVVPNNLTNILISLKSAFSETTPLASVDGKFILDNKTIIGDYNTSGGYLYVYQISGELIGIINYTMTSSIVIAPSVEVFYEYVPSSSGYSVLAQFTNHDTLAGTIYYNCVGDIATNGDVVLASKETSSKIMLGVVMSGNGIISAYTKNTDGYISGSFSKSWVVSQSVLSPIISTSQYGNDYTAMINIDNNNAEVETRYRTRLGDGAWSEERISNFNNYSFVMGNSLASGANLIVEAYAIFKGKKSSTTQKEFYLGGKPLPKLETPRIFEPTTIKTSSVYSTTFKVQNNNADTSVNVYAKINNNSFILQGEITPLGIGQYTLNVPLIDGSNGTISVYAEQRDYAGSDIATLEWGYTREVIAPQIEIINEYVPSSSGYAVKARFKNNDLEESKIIYTASGDLTTSGSVSGVGVDSWSELVSIGLVMSGSGIISASASNMFGVSNMTKSSWSVSQITPSPIITSRVYGGTNSLQFTITRVAGSGTTYYRVKNGTSVWGDWVSFTASSTNFVRSNYTAKDVIIYIEAYTDGSSVEKHSSTLAGVFLKPVLKNVRGSAFEEERDRYVSEVSCDLVNNNAFSCNYFAEFIIDGEVKDTKSGTINASSTNLLVLSTLGNYASRQSELIVSFITDNEPLTTIADVNIIG